MGRRQYGLVSPLGNWAVAKIIEVICNTPSLSDVGCTFRVLSRERAADVLSTSTVDGSSYGLEMLLLAIVRCGRIVQVPVNYRLRIGESSVAGQQGKTIALGLEMLRMVFRMRLRAARLRR